MKNEFSIQKENAMNIKTEKKFKSVYGLFEFEATDLRWVFWKKIWIYAEILWFLLLCTIYVRDFLCDFEGKFFIWEKGVKIRYDFKKRKKWLLFIHDFDKFA